MCMSFQLKKLVFLSFVLLYWRPLKDKKVGVNYYVPVYDNFGELKKGPITIKEEGWKTKQWDECFKGDMI